MRFSLLFILLGVFLLNACHSEFMHQETQEIAGAQWHYTDTLNFTFSIPDTNALYNLWVDIDYDDTYPKQNLYMKLHTLFPDGRRIEQVASFDLFDASGKSNGNCSGNTCKVHMLLQSKAFFNQTGDYVLTLEQFNRQETMEGLRSIGFAVEKLKEDRKKG
ncbi:MAG: gliding motility lipoprotein GldH [Lewinellaceae bacterium]|nr:gliding motility lipoprotein GldH [Lewinellaceae bacterium]